MPREPPKKWQKRPKKKKKKNQMDIKIVSTKNIIIALFIIEDSRKEPECLKTLSSIHKISHGKVFKECGEIGSSLMVQWLGLSTFTLEAQVQSLVWELKSHIKPLTVHHGQK